MNSSDGHRSQTACVINAQNYQFGSPPAGGQAQKAQNASSLNYHLYVLRPALICFIPMLKQEDSLEELITSLDITDEEQGQLLQRLSELTENEVAGFAEDLRLLRELQLLIKTEAGMLNFEENLAGLRGDIKKVASRLLDERRAEGEKEKEKQVLARIKEL
ncbi:hypothetical protein KJ596_04785 [Patescibacteria group bacterium]|nr:hypothetical protein [Patescibacteria group bacterium]